MLKNLFPFAIVLLLAFIAGFPLLHEGLPPTHDGEYHVVRFYEFDRSIRDGNWYPRWAADLNNGYGVPLFNYVYPLPNYVASFFHFLGFSFIDSFKLNMFFASIIGAIFFYFWAKGFWGSWGGMVGSVFYSFSPYHFVDIYIRGSVGEVWALAFFPAFLWAVTRFIRDNRQNFLPVSSVFLALIIFSHNILALMFFPLALSYCGFLLLGEKGGKGDWGGWEKWGKGILVFLLGIGLSAIFWLPALYEKQFVVGLEVFGFENHFPEFYQLIFPSWGSGFSGEGLESSLSFQIGVANLFALFLSLALLFVKKNKDRSIVLFFIILFFLIFFLMLNISLPIWKIVPFMNYFQFPWRFLSLEILIASFLAGSVVYFWKSKILVIFLIFLAFFLGIGYAKPAYYHYRDDNYYLTRSNFMDGTNSPDNAFNTVYFDTSLDKEKTKIKFLKGKGKIRQEVVRSAYYNFRIEVLEHSQMQVNTAFFPGWSVFVDGEKTNTDITTKGLFTFVLPKGSYDLKVRFSNTSFRNLAVLSSFISGLVVLALFIRTLFATIRK